MRRPPETPYPTDERGPLHGVPGRPSRRSSTSPGRSRRSAAGPTRPRRRADGAVVRRLRDAGAVVVGKTNMPEFGQWPFTESVTHGITRNPWDPRARPAARAAARRPPSPPAWSPVGHRWRRRRVDPDPGGVLRAVRAQATARPGHQRADAAPVVGARHGRPADPHRSPTARSSTTWSAAARPGDLFPAAEPVASFAEAAAARARVALRIGWSTKPVSLGVRPDPEHVARRRATTAAVLERARPRRRARSTPHYPDPTAAFVPQFFAGVRSEAEMVERPELLERRTRETARLGAWVRPAVVEWAIGQGREGRGPGQPGLRHRRRAAHPDDRAPAAAGSASSTAVGTVRAAWRSMPMIAYTALWNVAGNPAASVPAGIGSDGLPLGGPAGRAAPRRDHAAGAVGPARAGAALGRPAARPVSGVLLVTPRARHRSASPRTAGPVRSCRSPAAGQAGCW